MRTRSTTALWPGAGGRSWPGTERPSWPGTERPSWPGLSGPSAPARAATDSPGKPGHDGGSGGHGGGRAGLGSFRFRALRNTLVQTLLLALLLTPLAAHAVEPSERLANPALEARARTISAQLRCLVCQNESIDESGADLAHDIRMFVRERLTAGDTNAQAIQAVVNRYGAFVLLKPPVEPATYVLWYGPPLLVVTGLIGTVFWLRRRQPIPADSAPLTTDEARRIDRLMQENDV